MLLYNLNIVLESMCIIDILPSVTSMWGLVFYSVLSYIFSFTVSKLTSEFVARNLDVDGEVKKRIVEERRKK